MTEKRFLLIGGTGRVGSALAARLVSKGHHPVLLSRGANTARNGHRGAVVCCNIRNRGEVDAVLRDRFDGIFLATADARDQIEVETSIINAIKHSPTTRVVKLSAQSAGLIPPCSFGRYHRRIEEVLERSGLDFAVVRPTFFQQSLLLFTGEVAKGRLVAPIRAGQIAMVDVRDVAAVACSLLVAPHPPKRCVEITGPCAISFEEIARTMSVVVKRPVKLVAIPRPLARVVLPLAAGMSFWQARLVVELFAALERGAQQNVTDAVVDLTGMQPRSVVDFLHENADAFAGSQSQARA